MTELPELFWMSAKNGRVVPVDHMHKLTVMADPEMFGYSPNDVRRDLDLNLAFEHGWVRVTNSDGSTLNLETSRLRDASKVLRELLQQDHWNDVFLDFDHVDQSMASIRLEGHEEVESFAMKGFVPRRYAKEQALLNRRRVRPEPDPAGAVIAPMRAKVGTGVGDRMESFIARARAKLFERQTTPS